jgi:hypothetical protein
VTHFLDCHGGGVDKAEEVLKSCLVPAVRALLTAVQAGMLGGKCNSFGQTKHDGGSAQEGGKVACGMDQVLHISTTMLKRLAAWYGAHPYTAANGGSDVEELRSMLATCSGLQLTTSM